ncbi:MAG: hypothetical protein Q7R41_06600, partial [Phycisphaerales bacterium]|nr:hypothetical protein [Phycisphaerales bacterium]
MNKPEPLRLAQPLGHHRLCHIGNCLVKGADEYVVLRLGQSALPFFPLAYQSNVPCGITNASHGALHIAASQAFEHVSLAS